MRIKMKMKIEFKELPNNSFTDYCFTEMGIASDVVKSIVVNDIPVGVVCLSDVTGERIYIERIDFLPAFLGNRFLRPVMDELEKFYGKRIYFR